MKKRNLLFLVLGLPMVAFGQTKEERERIASFSNKEGNTKLALELKQEDDQRKLRLSNYLAANPFVKKVIKDDESGRLEIMDVLPNGELIYAKIDNAGAATTARATALYSGGSLGLNIQGQNMLATVWDAGSIRDTHQEFMVGGVSKITLMNGSPYHSHATHVGGTIAAQGIVSSVRGLAFNSSLLSYDWDSDLSEITNEASAGLLTSNHSYGMGSLGSAWFYGAYDTRARQLDNICFNNPYYLPVFSAGNDRNGTDQPASTQNATKGGFDLIFGHGNAKNILTVAAVNQVSSYTSPASVVMSTFSSWGPSDDGRIKPDISMKGVNVRSTYETSDTAIGFSSGTSMASPGVTGVVLLLQQYYNQLYAAWMRSATVKGLILHTADEAGVADGPDYEFGWGLINAENSAKVIRDKSLTTGRSIIEENILNNGVPFTKVINSNGTQPLKVSISWTDRQGTNTNNGQTDPTTTYLINDLDVKVTAVGSGTIYYPWKLQGMSAPSNVATNTSTNDVDNFERVDIMNPSGQYIITITNKGTLTGGSQNYSLIISGDNVSTLATNENNLTENYVKVYPNPTTDVLKISGTDAWKSVKILDASGRLIREIKDLKNNKIDVSSLSKGTYQLILLNENTNLSTKFIKK